MDVSVFTIILIFSTNTDYTFVRGVLPVHVRVLYVYIYIISNFKCSQMFRIFGLNCSRCKEKNAVPGTVDGSGSVALIPPCCHSITREKTTF
jgi:hypothetical protein